MYNLKYQHERKMYRSSLNGSYLLAKDNNNKKGLEIAFYRIEIL